MTFDFIVRLIFTKTCPKKLFDFLNERKRSKQEGTEYAVHAESKICIVMYKKQVLGSISMFHFIPSFEHAAPLSMLDLELMCVTE